MRLQVEVEVHLELVIHYLRRVRDFAQIKGDGNIDLEITKYSLEALNVDKYGLDEMDNKLLTTLIKKFKGGPVGITTLATAVSETSETIEEVYEPFLIQQGFLLRTPRGRQVTEKAYKHLNINILNDQSNLFNSDSIIKVNNTDFIKNYF